MTLHDFRPPPAQTDDGNAWTTGVCMTCFVQGDREDKRVLWTGDAVQMFGLSAPVFTCGPCIQAIDGFLWWYATASDMSRDRWGAPTPVYP